MKRLLEWWQATRLGRTLQRYGERGGAVLAGGVAYAALFSVFGALVAGFSVFGLVLGNNRDLFDQVVASVSEMLPGLLDTGDGGAIDPQTLIDSNLFSWAGIIAFLAALFAGIGWVGSLRIALRQMFDIPPDKRNVVVQKLFDVLWLATLGLVLLVSALLSMGVGSLARPVLEALQLNGPVLGWVLRLLAFALVVAVNFVALLIIYRWMTGLKLPMVRLWSGLLVGAVGMALLTNFSGQIVGSAGDANPVLATGALLVTLLVLFNFISRLMMYVACWIATFDPVPEPVPEREIDLEKEYVDEKAARGWKLEPTYSTRSADTTTAAAGFVLGAGAVVATRVVGGGLKSIAQLVRGRWRHTAPGPTRRLISSRMCAPF